LQVKLAIKSRLLPQFFRAGLAALQLFAWLGLLRHLTCIFYFALPSLRDYV
jgi:hypothetical protein